MADDTIQSIIAVEKEIQAQIAAEEAKIAAWLAERREALRHSRRQREEEQQKRHIQAKEKLQRQLTLQSTRIIVEANQEGEWLNSIPQETIDSRIQPHLRKILPG